MSVIEEQARQMKGIMDQIDSSAAEQAIAIAQITRDLESVSVGVQSSAASAEEGSSASQALSGQAAALHRELARFRFSSVEQTHWKTEETRLPLIDAKMPDNLPVQEMPGKEEPTEEYTEESEIIPQSDEPNLEITYSDEAEAETADAEPVEAEAALDWQPENLETADEEALPEKPETEEPETEEAS